MWALLVTLWGAPPEPEDGRGPIPVEDAWGGLAPDDPIAEPEPTPAEGGPPRQAPRPEPRDPEPEAEPAAAPAPSGARAEFKVELSGLLGGFVTIPADGGGLTFGGPKLGFAVGKFAMGASCYPSLLISRVWAKHEVRPSLGVGGEVSFWGVTVFVPVYFLGDRYRAAVGLGYRFNLVRMVAKDPEQRRKDRAARARAR